MGRECGRRWAGCLKSRDAFMKRLLNLWLPVEGRARMEAMRAALVVGGLLGLVVFWVVKHRVDWPEAAERFVARGLSLRAELVALGLVWKALVVDAILLAGLLVTVRWWAMPRGEVKAEKEEIRGARLGTAGMVMVVLILGVAVGLRGPRLGLSLYNDEAHNYARLFSGAWQQKGGEMKLDVPRWGETLFWNGAGNNSQLFSLAARGCLEVAEKAGWRVKGEVTECAVRLPALLAGLAMIGVLGVMVLAAVHPWFVRYSTEARGYSFMLLGIALILWFADRAMASGRWRDWGGYAVGLFVCAVSFLGSVYFLVCFSAGLLWHQGMRGKRSGDWSLLARPMVASLGAAMVGLVLLWPMIPPLLKVLEEHHSIRGEMGLIWWKDVAGYLVAGTRWIDWDPENPVNQAVGRWMRGSWWVPLILWLGFMGFGVRAMWREGGVWRVMAWAAPVSIGLAWALMARKGNFMNHWYVLHGVPWVVLAMSASWVKLTERKRLLGPVLLGVALLVPGRVAWALRTLPKQHEREPVVEALGAVYPGVGKTEPRPILGAFWCNSGLYHPEVVTIRDEANLEELKGQARAEGRPLFVCFSHRGVAVNYNAGLVKAVEDETVFEKVATYFGQEESQYSMQLFRMR